MEERYYSFLSAKKEYIVKDDKIIKKIGCVSLYHKFTEKFYNYIKLTCIKYYPRYELFFIFKIPSTVYYTIKLKEKDFM